MATADSAPLRHLRTSRLIAAARRAVPLVRRIPLALAIVLGIGIALRVVAWLAVHPAVMNSVDTPVYIGMADGGMFADPVRPAGYSMFLRALHSVSSDLDLTIASQHLLGIATSILLYATVRRIGAPVWAGVAAAAAVLVALDQVYLEHTILAECVFTFGLAVTLYASVRALDSPRQLVGAITTRHAWLVAAGLCLGGTAWVRGVGLPMVAFLALWFVLAVPGRWWVRIGRGALAGGAAAVALLVYFQLNEEATGRFGLVEGTGWGMYARVAPFADCTQFDPPEGTSGLCEDKPPIERQGSDFYTWNGRSPARRLFGYPPEGNSELTAFAREVIIHQPFRYGLVVLRDTTRYFAPDIDIEAEGSGTPSSWTTFARRDVNESSIAGAVRSYYPTETVHFNGALARTLTDLQALLRVQPALMLLSVILGAVGIWLSSGRVRAGLILLLGSALLLLVIPSATAAFSARYAYPAGGPFIAAGAIGVWVIFRRLLERQGTAGEPYESAARPSSAPSP
jgi:Dolichyl-phosphate-mannose-protein mannosyltransferase